MSEEFSDACEATILDAAVPFSRIDDAGRAGLADFLSAPVTLGDVTASREEHCTANEQVLIEFHERLRFVGRFAAEAGLSRIRHAVARRETASLDLTHKDLQEGEAITSSASGTGLCEDP